MNPLDTAQPSNPPAMRKRKSTKRLIIIGLLLLVVVQVCLVLYDLELNPRGKYDARNIVVEGGAYYEAKDGTFFIHLGYPKERQTYIAGTYSRTNGHWVLKSVTGKEKPLRAT